MLSVTEALTWLAVFLFSVALIAADIMTVVHLVDDSLFSRNEYLYPLYLCGAVCLPIGLFIVLVLAIRATVSKVRRH